MGRAARWKKKGSSKPNPYSVRGLDKLSQITSELTAKRQEIASKIGASPSCVWLTTGASSDDLVAIFPSSFANYKTATFEFSPDSPHQSSTSYDPFQRGSNSQEPDPSSMVDPLPKARKPTHFFTFIVLFVSYIREMLEQFIRRRQKSVYRRMESFAYEPGLGLKHPPRRSYSAGKSPGEQRNNTVNLQPIAVYNGSPVQATIAPNLTPLRRIIAALPQRSAAANSSPILFTLRALQASSSKSAEAKTQKQSKVALNSNSRTENSQPTMRMRGRLPRSSRTAKFPAREDRSYGAMVMLVIILGSLVFGIVPGVLATAISWFMLPQLREFVRNKDLRINGAGATKRKQSAPNIKARKMDQSASIQKRRCMTKSTS